jgi:hypothetical protein
MEHKFTDLEHHSRHLFLINKTTHFTSEERKPSREGITTTKDINYNQYKVLGN